MSYDEMVEFGKNEGYFNDAGVFIGAPESTVPFLGIRALAQFGENSQANRFAINFAQKCTTIVVQKHGVAAVELKELQSG